MMKPINDCRSQYGPVVFTTGCGICIPLRLLMDGIAEAEYHHKRAHTMYEGTDLDQLAQDIRGNRNE